MILVIASISTVCSFVMGWTIGFPFVVIIVIGMIYSFTALGDSPILSAGITESVDPSYLGAAFALRSFLGFGAGAIAPLVWLELKRIRRQTAMRKALPETLDFLADGVRNGRTLEQGTALVGQELSGPLADEFAHAASQLRLGHSPVAVLDGMAARVPLPEFKAFAVAAAVHRQTGGNLSLLAQRLAGSARDRQEFRGHMKAVTAASRFSVIGLTLGTLAALGILAWLRPEYLHVFRTHEMGPSLLALAGALQVVGIVWVWRTLKVHF